MLVLPADVTDAAAVPAAAARVREELGPIDLAVLSAGYWKQMDPADWDTDVFDQHIRVNLAGMSNSIAAVLPGMLQRHHGVIAGIASVAATAGWPAPKPTARPRRPRSTCSSPCASTSHEPACRSRLSAPASSGPASRPQPLPHALHHRCWPGRTIHLRRTGARPHRDHLPRPDGPADEDRAPRPRPGLAALWARTSLT